MATQNHIIIEKLDKVFTTGRGERQVVALDKLDLRVKEGQFFSVLGPSGCGKSTLLRIVGGLIEPTAGTVTMGNDTGPHDAQRAKEIGFVFQEPGLLPWTTVVGNIEMPLKINRKANRPHQRTIEELLELVGLEAFAVIHGGEWRSFGPFERLGSFIVLEQLAGGSNGALDLPQGAPALVRERVQRADVRQRRQLVPPQPGAANEVPGGCESAHGPQWHAPFVRAGIAEVRPRLPCIPHHFDHRVIV